MKKLLLAAVILMIASALVFAGGGRQSASTGSGAITVEIFDRGTDGGRSLAHDNAWTTWIKEKVKKDINIDVTFTPVGRWSETTDIVNLMASSSAPDLCYTYSGDMVANFRDQGGILDLAPYIDTLLPDLKKQLGADPAFSGKDFIVRNAVQEASGNLKVGQIFSIPSYRVALAQRNVFIRKDWLDKLGLPVPTNLTEFYNALTAFRERDPGNVGRNRVVPYAQNSDIRWGLADFLNHHITTKTDRDRWVYTIAERNVYAPGYKEGVRLMNKWYNERLIYQDFPLMTTADDLYNQMKSGVVGAFSQNWDLPYRTDYNINVELAKNVPGAEFVPVFLNLSNKDMMDKVGLQIFVPSFSKNPEGALRYLNWLAKPENYKYLQIGEEGRNHTIVNGVPSIQARPAGDPWFQNSAQNIDYTMQMNGVEMGNDTLNARVLALSYAGIPSATIENAYAIAIRNARAPVVRQVTTRVNQYSQTLQDKADALLAQAITAPTANFDRVWDAGIQDWLSSGGKEVYDERASLWK
ncbi:MAG: extracellular solute-binding protein [Treponema sp.]|nr:extracellular solute-binding protein [Treponema sp.]